MFVVVGLQIWNFRYHVAAAAAAAVIAALLLSGSVVMAVWKTIGTDPCP